MLRTNNNHNEIRNNKSPTGKVYSHRVLSRLSTVGDFLCPIRWLFPMLKRSHTLPLGSGHIFLILIGEL